jgi:hypothetical protein
MLLRQSALNHTTIATAERNDCLNILPTEKCLRLIRYKDIIISVSIDDVHVGPRCDIGVEDSSSS